MTKVTVNRATHINLTYSGQGKYTVTWQALGGKCRRTIHIIQWREYEDAALEAAEMFVAWQNETLIHTHHQSEWQYVLTAVTLSFISGNKYAIAIQSDAEEISTEVAA
tara:strand:+ start:5002 stop:5325 length:324 start_codon:yes stop_codon:yes gene_type:complete